MTACLPLPLLLLIGGFFLLALASFSRGAGDTGSVVGMVDGCGKLVLGLALLVAVLLLLSIS
jgi:hypothetical protein